MMHLKVNQLKVAKKVSLNAVNAKKVVEPVECYKCFENFHPKCIEQAANQKSTYCKHEEGNLRKLVREISELRKEKDIMKIELTYTRQLLKEFQEKNEILMENNVLLRNQSIELKKPKPHNINKEKK